MGKAQLGIIRGDFYDSAEDRKYQEMLPPRLVGVKIDHPKTSVPVHQLKLRNLDKRLNLVSLEDLNKTQAIGEMHWFNRDDTACLLGRLIRRGERKRLGILTEDIYEFVVTMDPGRATAMLCQRYEHSHRELTRIVRYVKIAAEITDRRAPTYLSNDRVIYLGCKNNIAWWAEDIAGFCFTKTSQIRDMFYRRYQSLGLV